MSHGKGRTINCAVQTVVADEYRFQLQCQKDQLGQYTKSVYTLYISSGCSSIFIEMAPVCSDCSTGGMSTTVYVKMTTENVQKSISY